MGDDETRRVIFRDTDGKAVTLRPGQQLSLGGGSFSADTEWANEMDWVNPPNPECVTDHRWLVTGGDVDK